MVKEITDFLGSIAPIPQPCVNTIHGMLVIDELPKKEILLMQGQISDRVYFIRSGLVRSFYIDDTGAERTGWFMKEQDVIASPRSFFNREPSNEYIETLEPTIAGSISYAELESLYDEFPEFNRVGRIINQQYNVLAVTRAELLRISNATIRYQTFVENNPALVEKNRVATRYIATYLGIDEAHLYKIKNGNYNKPRR